MSTPMAMLTTTAAVVMVMAVALAEWLDLVTIVFMATIVIMILMMFTVAGAVVNLV